MVTTCQVDYQLQAHKDIKSQNPKNNPIPKQSSFSKLINLNSHTLIRLSLFYNKSTTQNMDNQSNMSMGSSSSQKQMKQHYLRQEIIDAGYEPEQFVHFLNDKLNVESDIERCTLEQLEAVVIEFKAVKNREKNQLKNYYKEEYNSLQSDPLCEKISIISDTRQLVLRSQPLVQVDEFMDSVKCIKIVPKHPKIQSITCEVASPERREIGGIMGLGATSFFCFKVWSYGLNKEFVWRRYSDFIWLRNTLVKFYPSQIIPPIPNKKASKRSSRQIQKRMRILSMFLNDLVHNEVLFNNKYVEGFLSISDHKKFQRLKEQAENIKPYESIFSTQTKTGTVWLQLTERTLNFKDGLNKFIPEAEKLYKQITRNSKKMRGMTVETINLLYEMSNQFAELHSKANKFNAFVKSESTHKLGQIYAVLNNVMAEWGNSYKDIAEQIEKNLSTFFKYVREDFMGFKEVIVKEQAIFNEILRQRDILDKQKEKIFQLRDPKKWEIPAEQIKNLPKSAIFDRKEAFKIMLPKQSVKVEREKEKLAYFLSELNRNGETNFMRTIDKFCQNFKEFSIKMKVNTQKVGATWTEVSAKFSDPFRKPQDILKMQSICEVTENMEESSKYY